MKSKIITIVAVLCLLTGLEVSAIGQKKSGKKHHSVGPVTKEFGR